MDNQPPKTARDEILETTAANRRAAHLRRDNERIIDATLRLLGQLPNSNEQTAPAAKGDPRDEPEENTDSADSLGAMGDGETVPFDTDQTTDRIANEFASVFLPGELPRTNPSFPPQPDSPSGAAQNDLFTELGLRDHYAKTDQAASEWLRRLEEANQSPDSFEQRPISIGDIPAPESALWPRRSTDASDCNKYPLPLPAAGIEDPVDRRDTPGRIEQLPYRPSEDRDRGIELLSEPRRADPKTQITASPPPHTAESAPEAASSTAAEHEDSPSLPALPILIVEVERPSQLLRSEMNSLAEEVQRLADQIAQRRIDDYAYLQFAQMRALHWDG